MKNKETTDNMGFARCGVEGTPQRNSRKYPQKTFPFFSFVLILKNGKSFC